jgi:uncharacterized membrane protein
MINWIKNKENKFLKIINLILMLAGLINIVGAILYKLDYYQPNPNDIFSNILCLGLIFLLIGIINNKNINKKEN